MPARCVMVQRDRPQRLVFEQGGEEDACLVVRDARVGEFQMHERARAGAERGVGVDRGPDRHFLESHRGDEKVVEQRAGKVPDEVVALAAVDDADAPGPPRPGSKRALGLSSVVLLFASLPSIFPFPARPRKKHMKHERGRTCTRGKQKRRKD